MIYLLIAGSYTPFTLIPLKGGWGWSLFGLSWGLALFGIIQELTIGRKSEKRLLSMMILRHYGLADFSCRIATGTHPSLCRAVLVAWWYFYTAQAFIGLLMIPKIKHGHGIWHLFVLGGSIAQFLCIYFYVL